MWNVLNCYLSGRHEYGPWCEPGAIFLRCVHCGKRTSGWSITPDTHRHKQPPPEPVRQPVVARAAMTPAEARVLPFGRVAAG
jgi:hypothetical protein